MISEIKKKAKDWLLWSQKYTKADMFYIASNSFWTTFSFGISSLFSLVLVFFLANYLSKETYGTYKYVMSLVGALGFLTLSGMGTAITQAVSKGHDGILNYAVKIQLKWSILFFVAATSLGGYYLVNGNNVVGLSILIIGVSFPIIDSFNAFGPFLSGKKEFKRLALWSIATNVIYTSFIIVAILLGKTVISLVVAYSFSNLLTTIILYKRTLKIYEQKKHPSGEKELFKYGLNLSLVNILATLSQYIDKLVVFHFLGAIQLAIYGIALAIPERIRGYTKSLNSITLPKLSEKNIADIRPVFYRRVIQSMIIGLFISIIYVVASPLVFKLFLPQYLESTKYSQIISLSLILNMPLSYIGSVFRSQKMLSIIFISSTSYHASRIILFIIFGSLWGIWGVIYGSLLAYGAGLLFYIFLWEIEQKNPKNILS